MENKTSKNKRVAMLIAFQDFRDEEYFIPKSVFEEAGCKVKTVSVKKGRAIGSYGGVVDVDIALDDLVVSQFAAVVFVGGQGMAKNINNEKHQKIAKEAAAQGKIIGAICIAPAILARSGILKGKKAAVWASQMDKSAVKILQEEGVDYQPDDVVIDGNFITANGPLAARKFAQAIVDLLVD